MDIMQQIMVALLVLLLLLAAPLTAFTTSVYYVTSDDAAGHEQSCPPHQICHNLSYYISQPDHYFTSDTAIVFLEGQHSFDRQDLVQVNNVRKLTVEGQGEWPVAGADETVMQSTVIINCTRGRGGFIFDTGYDITIEGLTITNCGHPNDGVFQFTDISNLFFHRNSIQFMSGYGIMVSSCVSVVLSNCSFYHSVVCLTSGGGVAIYYGPSSHKNYSLELTFSNFTKCYNPQLGGAIYLHTNPPIKAILSNLVVSHSSARYYGGCLFVTLTNDAKTSLSILNSNFLNCSTLVNGGGVYISAYSSASITFKNTKLIENTIINSFSSELALICRTNTVVHFSLLDSTIIHTKASSTVLSVKYCGHVTVNNTQLTMANQRFAGFELENLVDVSISNSRFHGCYNLPSVLLVTSNLYTAITNSIFFNNTNGRSVITFYKSQSYITNSIISDNSMAGITALRCGIDFHGRNVIQNNRHTEGAGITLFLPGIITTYDKLYLLNNTAVNHGGAILVIPVSKPFTLHYNYIVTKCSFDFSMDSSISFSGNTAGKGGDNVYGATLINCEAHFGNKAPYYVGQRNETSYYFDSPLLKYFHIADTDRLSSMSSDPIMVCFCVADRPDCSNRTHHIQTYPGLEINTTIATVGYYGGTSPGVVQVRAQNAKLVHFYGQTETTSCFQLHILLEKMFSSTELVDIKVEGGLKAWGLSLIVDLLDCPTGFFAVDKNSEQHHCRCVPLLANNHVQCNVTLKPYMFVRPGNSWFGYINNTQCITGTTNCPFDYCNRSNVSFDIMAPDRQCLGNRTGILCGQCQSHLSIMLGSNRCGTCSNWYLFLLPVFGLAGIVLVVVLMSLNLSVSVGTINGLLFYANMVKLNEAFFFPNGSIPVVSQFISWLNLDLGIEVCLFDGLDGYWNTWLQFVFPAYLFLLMGCIIVGCRYSVWLCRLCGSHAVPALATLFLMSYIKILLTVTNALSMSQLPCNDSILTVWSVDGNIEYGSGKHLVLVIFSCGVLVVGLAYPVLVLCAPLFERYSDKCRWNFVARLKPLLDAYGGPFKDKYRFWTGVTLIVRLTLTVTFSFTSGGLAVVNAYIISTVIVGIFTIWFFLNGVYKSVYISALEMLYLLNLYLLSIVCLSVFSLDLNSKQTVTIISICVSLVVCLVTMAVHIRKYLEFQRIKRKLGFKDRPEYIAVPQVAAGEEDEDDKTPRSASPPSMVYGSSRGEHQFVLEFTLDDQDQESLSPVLMEREPLLFDTNMSS